MILLIIFYGLIIVHQVHGINEIAFSAIMSPFEDKIYEKIFDVTVLWLNYISWKLKFVVSYYLANSSLFWYLHPGALWYVVSFFCHSKMMAEPNRLNKWKLKSEVPSCWASYMVECEVQSLIFGWLWGTEPRLKLSTRYRAPSLIGVAKE